MLEINRLGLEEFIEAVFVVGYALHSIFLQNLGSVNGRKRGQTRDSRTSNKEAVYAKMR